MPLPAVAGFPRQKHIKAFTILPPNPGSCETCRETLVDLFHKGHLIRIRGTAFFPMKSLSSRLL